MSHTIWIYHLLVWFVFLLSWQSYDYTNRCGQSTLNGSVCFFSSRFLQMRMSIILWSVSVLGPATRLRLWWYYLHTVHLMHEDVLGDTRQSVKKQTPEKKNCTHLPIWHWKWCDCKLWRIQQMNDVLKFIERSWNDITSFGTPLKLDEMFYSLLPSSVLTSSSSPSSFSYSYILRRLRRFVCVEYAKKMSHWLLDSVKHLRNNCNDTRIKTGAAAAANLLNL